MIFNEARLGGMLIIDLERREDERGFFARSWCSEEFKERGLSPVFVQCNVSFNKKRGTLRGMHYQISPYAEAKLIRCTRGAIYDVAIDLRPDSPTFLQWEAVTLTEENHRMAYVPEGFAHGFRTLQDNTEITYQVSAPYAPEYARGVRWDDPIFDIRWPEGERTILERDRSYPDFRPEVVRRG
jgi:dTDP-4-dehydrorhamnose 3,5-epimerase